MNRSELIEVVSSDTGLTRPHIELALDALIYRIVSGLKSGDTIRITGFGTFKIRERKARQGRNPQTGAAVKIKASKGIGFTPSARLKENINARSALNKPKRVEDAMTIRSVIASKRVTTPAAPAKRQTALSTTKAPAKKIAATKAPAKKIAATKAPAKKIAATKAPAKKIAAVKAPAKKAVVTKAPAKKIAAVKAPAKKAVATKAPAKKIAAVKAPAKKIAAVKAPAKRK